MKRAPVVILLGLAVGALAHVGWYLSQRPSQNDNLDCQLEWMKTELNLTNEQFARIKQIHEQSSPRLLALASEVARMREEYNAFEQERATDGRVDFIEFARFVEQRRTVDRECLTSTRRLVADASQVMNDRQRRRYLALLGPVLQGERRPLLN